MSDIGTEKGKAERQFARMSALVREIFPDLSDGQVRHACNAISNGLRSWKGDIYEVHLSGSPFDDDGGYYHYFDVMLGGRLMYVRVTVD